MCKKNLILDSGSPVTLPLYPGECNLPTSAEISAEDRIETEDSKNLTHFEKSKFVPTPVVKIGNEIIHDENDKAEKKPPISFRDAIEILNLPWPNERENKVDSEGESSRAFNTRIILQPDNEGHKNKTEILREVVEPILKPHATKNGRSHDPNREKSEISEPILGPTTIRSVATTRNDIISKFLNSNKETEYNFYDVNSENEWVPATSSIKSEKWKRQDDSKVIPLAENNRQERNENGFTAIVKTVQFLPQRLARMFEEAEKYARERILPLVSNYTPKFISDFITPKEPPKYIPVSYVQTTEKYIAVKTNKAKENFVENTPTTTENLEPTTIKHKASHIQKIARKGEKVSVIFPEIQTTTVRNYEKDFIRSFGKEKSHDNKEETAKREIKQIHIDLPVFENTKQILYIPLNKDATKEK